jgi:hypothetical protein
MKIAYCVTAAAVAALILVAAAQAQSYPVKPERIVVPVAPGGGTDPQAELPGRKFQEIWHSKCSSSEPSRRIFGSSEPASGAPRFSLRSSSARLIAHA